MVASIKHFLLRLVRTIFEAFKLFHEPCQNLTFSVFFVDGLIDQIRLDRYLLPHFRYYMREVRTVAYSQFLESYKSVTMEAMAKAFGVSVDFIDR
jgi:26S proteasome regulatory subunit N7